MVSFEDTIAHILMWTTKGKRNAENRTKWTPIRNSMKISSMCYVVAHLVRSVMINPLPPLNSVPSELNSALLNSKNPP